jgi:hypothetical protein
LPLVSSPHTSALKAKHDRKAASDTFGGDHYVLCSVVLPALRNLLKIMTPTDDDPQWVSRFNTVFKEHISRKFSEDTDSEWLAVATALDPRFKKLQCIERDQRSGVWSVIQELLDDEECLVSLTTISQQCVSCLLFVLKFSIYFYSQYLVSIGKKGIPQAIFNLFFNF